MVHEKDVGNWMLENPSSTLISVLTKLIAETWECSDIATKTSNTERSQMNILILNKPDFK